MKDLFGKEDNGAIFSDDGKYRFVLWRIWNQDLPLVMFIGLNPSTANSNTDDPTIRRIKSFVKVWRYGGFYMLNLYTFISAYPEKLKECHDPVWKADDYLKQYSTKVNKIIFAWGNFPVIEERAKQVIKMFPEAEVLGLNKNGTPKHPLYLKSNIKPFKYHKLIDE